MFNWFKRLFNKCTKLLTIDVCDPFLVRVGDPVYIGEDGLVAKTSASTPIGIALHTAKAGESVLVDLGDYSVKLQTTGDVWTRLGVDGGERPFNVPSGVNDSIDRSLADVYGSCVYERRSKWACRRCKWVNGCKE